MRSGDVNFDGPALDIVTAFVIFIDNNSRFQFLSSPTLLFCFLTFPVPSSPSLGHALCQMKLISLFLQPLPPQACWLVFYPLCTLQPTTHPPFLPFQSLFVLTIKPACITSCHWEVHRWIDDLLQRFGCCEVNSQMDWTFATAKPAQIRQQETERLALES